MFFYLYDAFMLDAKQAGVLSRVEARIIELGINGRVEHITPERNLKSLITTAVKQQAHTIVVVGNDELFLRTVNVSAPYDIVLGYIPCGTQSTIAKVLGIPDTLEACNILSRRITQQLDLGKINQNFFLLAATISNANQLKLRCDNTYTLNIIDPATEISLEVLGTTVTETTAVKKPGSRGTIRLLIQHYAQSRWQKRQPTQDVTELYVHTLALEHAGDRPIDIVLDQLTTLRTPATISLKPRQLKVIVGKGRRLAV